MAVECCSDLDLEKGVRGVRFSEYDRSGIGISRLEITSAEGEKIIGKPIGKYITLTVGKIWLSDDETRRRAVNAFASELRGLAEELCPKIDSVLVAGLGNRYITSDSIGSLAVKNVTVTRHIRDCDRALFDRICDSSVAAVAPGVVGQTGIETVELIRGASETVAPSLVVVIDALAAKSTERLAVTVQLSDTGIAPGSGIGNKRLSVDKSTVGFPVISVGVPTVVNSSTLICDFLERAGFDIPDALADELEREKGFFVTLKDADAACSEMASLIAEGIDIAFGKNPPKTKKAPAERGKTG